MRTIYTKSCLHIECVLDLNVEVFLVGEVLAGQMSPRMTTGPNPLLAMSAWSSKIVHLK